MNSRSIIGIGLAACAVAVASPVSMGASGATASVTAGRTTATYAISLPVPPRLQWNANNGYCGEVTFISAGLHFGQYLSQYDARAIASNGTPQYELKAQLLLGVNDTHAASQMRLASTAWTPGAGSTASSFLTWVKTQVIEGHPVAIGVYTNEYLFYGSTNPNAGDPQYDHIVVVTGIKSAHPLTLPAAYYATDQITFSDNGLWTGTASGRPQYSFSYVFGSFQATRQQANAKTGNIYSLADTARDYGIALTGVADPGNETMPVSVSTSVNYEKPGIRNGSTVRPAPMPLTLTVTVSGLTPGRSYDLYRYDSVTVVPTASFNANAAAASQAWSFSATAGTWSLTQQIQSNEEVVYRAVPTSGP
ncbi:MAG TPA: hypothetical protein VGS21_07315 [Acidimicrobiales bacterium]|nr:hypothetical protein [Acidimicrobiales bacterium]